MKKPLLIVQLGISLITKKEQEEISKGFEVLKDDFYVVIYNHPSRDTKFTLICEEAIKVIEI